MTVASLSEWKMCEQTENAMTDHGCITYYVTIYSGSYTTKFGELPGYIEERVCIGFGDRSYSCYIEKLPAELADSFHQHNIRWNPYTKRFLSHFTQEPLCVADAKAGVEITLNRLKGVTHAPQGI